MNPDASADWASVILGLHQLLSDHLHKAQPGVPPVRLPDPTDWLQTMAQAGQPGLAPGLASPLELEGLPTHFERDTPQGSAAQRCHAAASALQAAWLEIGSDTFDALRQALSDESAPQDVRGIYDLWVSCGEKAFARQAASERYADLISELINAQVSLLLACGIGSAPPPQNSAALKDELAAAQAREAKLRADLETLRKADAAHTAPRKKRDAKKKIRSTKVEKKKRSTKKTKAPPRASTPDRRKTETVSACGKGKKASRKKTASASRQRPPKP
ncbi:MAG: hypothetical protein L7T80_00160 [Arenicellales bacterium]|nr:hypothetical protein [Arenicellales bacterium]